MATLGFAIKIDGLDDDSLVVRGFEGQELLSDGPDHSVSCTGFRYHIDLANRNGDIKPDQVVDMNAELRIFRDEECVQRVHGVVRQFTQGEIGYHHNFYSLVLVPALERLSLRHNSRIFQQKSSVDIVTTLLQEMGIQDFAFSLTRTCQPREFCVQYRETDLDFLHRLAAEEGWVYYFEHMEGKHTLVFSDASFTLPKLSEAIVHNSLSGGKSDIPYISAFGKHTRSDVAQVELKDYSFKKPAYGFAQSQSGANMAYQRDSYEHYDYPGRYKDDGNGKAFSKIRLEYLRREAHLASGKSDQPLVRAGYRFDIEEHLNSEMNSKWIVVSVNHSGTQPQALEEGGGHGATTYSNAFNVIPSKETWRATPQPKPRIDGPMIAIVTGPPGEEIYCDEYGRVKVHFPWDRESQQNETSSCWVRVSQGWGGSQFGMVAIPRIGHEVIVSFLNGDPDQPIITGRTYHSSNMPPYALPANKTRTVIKTQTHQGDGFNELRFEDMAGSEEIFIHAQKDQNNVVLNDETTNVGNDRSEDIGNDETINIGNDRTETVGSNETITISANRTETVGGNETVTIKGNQAETIVIAKAESIGAAKALTIGAAYQVSVGAAMNRTVGLSDSNQVGGSKSTRVGKNHSTQVGGNKSTDVKKKIQITAGDEIVLKTGKASLTMKSDGTITLKGADITVDGSGAIKVKAKQDVVIKGKKIKEN